MQTTTRRCMYTPGTKKCSADNQNFPSFLAARLVDLIRKSLVASPTPGHVNWGAANKWHILGYNGSDISATGTHPNCRTTVHNFLPDRPTAARRGMVP